MANPEGHVVMDEEQARAAEERYARMEATLHVIYSRDSWKCVDSFFFHFALSAAKRIRGKRPTTSPHICNVTLALVGSMLQNCGST